MELNKKNDNSSNDIDDFLKFSSLHDIEIPDRINQKIEYTLLHKNKQNVINNTYNFFIIPP